MTWNLWNVVRHYVFIKWFKNKHRALGNDQSSWGELEARTHKIVKGIYRTYQQKKQQFNDDGFTFGNIDKSNTYEGDSCVVQWTNSFVQISSILERNAREHASSLVMFTGDVRQPDSEENEDTWSFKEIRQHPHNFVVSTLDGVDSEETGIRPR